MKKFEGNINGKIYTNEKEFNKALLELDKTDDVYVSYRYISAPSASDCAKDEHKLEDCKNAIVPKNYVSENEYIKHITNKKDVELDDNLINKLKSADNKSDIKDVVYKKIMGFDAKIEDNLLHINELVSDYKKLEEKMEVINNQIKTLDDANNNYYLNKEYYTNINSLVDDTLNTNMNEDCNCDSGCKCNGNCNCNMSGDEFSVTLEDIYNMTPYKLTEYLKKRNINTLSDLVEYFLKNY